MEYAVSNLDPEVRESLAHDIAGAGVNCFPLSFEGGSSTANSSPKTKVTRLMPQCRMRSTGTADYTSVLVDGDDQKGRGVAGLPNSDTKSTEVVGKGVVADSDLDDSSSTRSLEEEPCNIESALADLNAVLLECRESLGVFDKKEKFVDLRLRRYRQLMLQGEDRIVQLEESMSSSQQGTSEIVSLNDAEEGTTSIAASGRSDDNVELKQQRLQTMQTKHERNRSSLGDVELIQRDIIAHMEVLRRKIEVLENKREDMLEKRGECREFLLTAGELI